MLFIQFRCVYHAELRERLIGHASLLTVLTLAQVSLGLGSFYAKLILPKAISPRTLEVLVTTAHQATGALVLATCLLLTLRAFRYRYAPAQPGRA